LKDSITAAVDARHADAVAFLAALVRMPSDNPPGDCAPHAAEAARLLEGLGFAVERHPVPAEVCAGHGMVSATNLIVRRRFGAAAGPVIALNAHGDVVPPGDGWSYDPYGAAIADGRMYGRGVAVSKSDFATYAFALLALEASGAPLAGTVELHFTYDEETGGETGPARLLAEGLTKPDYVISAGFAHGVVVASNGCLHLEAVVRGRSAHAARPETGADALEATTALLAALYAERARFAAIASDVPGITHPTLTVGLIRGGINTNVVPDNVTLRLDRRIIPEEDAAEVEAGLRATMQQAVAGFPGIGIAITRILLARPLGFVPGQDKLAAAIQANAQAVLGEAIPAEGVPLYTDARLYGTAGIPTVGYGAGPRSLLEANGHRADENLLLEDLRAATKVVALTVADLLASPPPG
jgi:acetylornithine deacetylase/succinyl-diaminopimelate desuccinylase-like protein